MHKAFIACSVFGGKDKNNLHKLFRDNLRELYYRLFDIDAKARDALEDNYTAISYVMEAARDNHTVEINTHHLLHLFEFFKIVKIRGVHSSYACMESHGI